MAQFIPIDVDNDAHFNSVLAPLISSNDSPAPGTSRKSVRDLKAPWGIDSQNSLATELKGVRTDMAEQLEPLGEKVDRILEVAEGLVEFVNGNCKTLEGVLEQAKAGMSGPVTLVDVHQMGHVLLEAIREEGPETRVLIQRQAVEMRSFIERQAAEVDSAVAVPAVPPVDLAVTHTLMMRQYNEMRRVIASEHEKTRWFTAQCTMVVLLFIVAHFVLNYVHSLWTPVCAMAPPVPPVCVPGRDTALPSMWDNYMSCARIFTKDTY